MSGVDAGTGERDAAMALVGAVSHADGVQGAGYPAAELGGVGPSVVVVDVEVVGWSRESPWTANASTRAIEHVPVKMDCSDPTRVTTELTVRVPDGTLKEKASVPMPVTGVVGPIFDLTLDSVAANDAKVARNWCWITIEFANTAAR